VRGRAPRLACVALLVTATPLAVGADPAAPPPSHEDLAPTGPSLAQRLAEIQQRVQRAAVYPPIARLRGVSGDATVEFEVAADGRPPDVRTVDSSGSALLDRAAERAVRDAAPLPFVHGPVRVPVRFALRDPS
jgi:TonB family protein